MTSREFGSDFGVVHEALVTGRKCGAGRDFWSRLAHSPVIFKKVVRLVEHEVISGFRITFGTIDFKESNPLASKAVPRGERWYLTGDRSNVDAENTVFRVARVLRVEDGETEIRSEREFFDRAERYGAIYVGWKHGEVLLERFTDLLPLRGFRINFPATKYGIGGCEGILVLCWDHDRNRWRLIPRFLQDPFGEDDLFLIPFRD